MAAKSYKLADGATMSMYVFDPPAGTAGKRQQKLKRSFRTEQAAIAAEIEARKLAGETAPAGDGTIAAELRAWVADAEIDLQVTSTGWYSDMYESYVIPYIGTTPVHRVDARMINRLCRTLLARGRTRRKGQGDGTQALLFLEGDRRESPGLATTVRNGPTMTA